MLLGIYARDDLDPAEARDVTPRTTGPRTLAGRLDALATQPDAETVEAEAPTETPTETVDPETGEVVTMVGGPVIADAPSEDPRTWSAADAYHYGEDARKRGVTRRAVVPPAIRDHEVLAPAVISGWESASANP